MPQKLAAAQLSVDWSHLWSRQVAPYCGYLVLLSLPLSQKSPLMTPTEGPLLFRTSQFPHLIEWSWSEWSTLTTELNTGAAVSLAPESGESTLPSSQLQPANVVSKNFIEEIFMKGRLSVTATCGQQSHYDLKQLVIQRSGRSSLVGQESDQLDWRNIALWRLIICFTLHSSGLRRGNHHWLQKDFRGGPGYSPHTATRLNSVRLVTMEMDMYCHAIIWESLLRKMLIQMQEFSTWGEALPVTVFQFWAAIASDRMLSKIYGYTKGSWSCHVPANLCSFFTWKDESIVLEGVSYVTIQIHNTVTKQQSFRFALA